MIGAKKQRYRGDLIITVAANEGCENTFVPLARAQLSGLLSTDAKFSLKPLKNPEKLSKPYLVYAQAPYEHGGTKRSCWYIFELGPDGSWSEIRTYDDHADWIWWISAEYTSGPSIIPHPLVFPKSIEQTGEIHAMLLNLFFQKIK